MVIVTLNNTYEVVNFKRKDELYNVFVHKTSNLTGVYKGEATYCIGVKKPVELSENDVINLKFELF